MNDDIKNYLNDGEEGLNRIGKALAKDLMNYLEYYEKYIIPIKKEAGLSYYDKETKEMVEPNLEKFKKYFGLTIEN